MLLQIIKSLELVCFNLSLYTILVLLARVDLCFEVVLLFYCICDWVNHLG